MLQKKNINTLENVARKEMSIYYSCLEKAPGAHASPYANQCIHDIPMPKSMPYILRGIYLQYQYSQLHLEFTGKQSLNPPYLVIIVLASWIPSPVSHYFLHVSADMCGKFQHPKMTIAGKFPLKDCNGQKFPAASNRPRWALSNYLWLEWWYVKSPPSTKTSVCSRRNSKTWVELNIFWFGVSFWRIWGGCRESC